MTRYDVTNLFHFSEDLVTTFLSLLLLQHADPDAGGPSTVTSTQLVQHLMLRGDITPEDADGTRGPEKAAHAVTDLAGMWPAVLSQGGRMRSW